MQQNSALFLYTQKEPITFQNEITGGCVCVRACAHALSRVPESSSDVKYSGPLVYDGLI
jgi:hypothetical protein